MYSAIGILAMMIHLIVNADIFRDKGGVRFPAAREYRLFLSSIFAFFVADALWGVLYGLHLTPLLYADTVIYFAVMALSVLLWSLFAVHYLERENAYSRALIFIGRLFFAVQLLMIALNFFKPVLFMLDEGGEYHACTLRYATLTFQMIVFLLTSFSMFYVALKSEGTVKHRHVTIGFFGIAMILAIAAQIFYPLMPLYSIGYLLGVCVLHTFLVEDQKAEYLAALEEALKREEAQKQELIETRSLAYTDPLTGVKSKHAYVEAEECMNRRVAQGEASQFAVAVFDLNGLKSINDTLGHEAGDKCITAAAKLICNTFKHSPVYRIGGDEFSAILEGQDFENRDALLFAFDRAVEENMRRGEVVVSIGLAEFEPGLDDTFGTVFQRADQKMYSRKRALKGTGSVIRDAEEN